MSGDLPYIMGLDIASNCGVCEGYPGETPRIYDVRFAKADDSDGEVYARALKWATSRLITSHIDWCFLEAPVPGIAMQGRTNAATIARLWGLAACIEGVFVAKRVATRRANIAAVRKRFLGTARLDRKEAKRQTVEKCRALGWEVPSDDAADAVAVWHYGVLQVAPRLAPIVDPLFLKMKGAKHEGANS